MSEFYNIQSASPQYVPYGSTTNQIVPKPITARQSGSAPATIPIPNGQMSNGQMPNGPPPVLKEGLDESDYSTLTTNPRYDMSDKILTYPPGHPLYAPQTLAEVRRTDSDAMLRSENMIFGIALASGISIIVLGFLMSSGTLSAPDIPTQM
jgi:hypothetical protein